MPKAKKQQQQQQLLLKYFSFNDFIDISNKLAVEIRTETIKKMKSVLMENGLFTTTVMRILNDFELHR
jgi:hypothetical protein